MSVWDRIAEQKIRDAEERGAFAGLAGAGKPLDLRPESGPAEMRMANKILKNAGVVPEEMRLRGEVARLEAMLDATREDDPERAALLRRLLDTRLHYDLMRERRRS